MSDFGTLSLAELEQMAASIGQEIRDKQVQGRFLHYRPTAAQEEWWNSDKQFVIACGPNRQGKSDFITARAIADCSGWLPTYFTDGKMPSGFPDLRGFKAMIVGENFNAAVATTIVPKLRSFLMPEMLARQPKKNSAGVEYEWDFRSGAKLFVRSWDQRREAFESADLDRVYCDEPPEEDKWYAIRRGLVDRAGRAFFAMTPKGHITWFKDQYVDAAVDADNPLHAYVDFFTFDFHSNCTECSGGYVPHAELLKLEAEIPDSEKHSRVYGLFDELQGFEFAEWKEEIHVVPDFKVPHEWPMVEIVDPSIKRGFHILRAVVDPEEDWYVVEARQILHDSFTETCNEIHAGRLRWGRQPALAIMDARGGRHRTDPVGDANRDWFYEFANHDLVYAPSVTTPFEKLHDWLKPRYNPQKDRVVPKLRAFQSAADAKQKGLSWAFQRFRWDRAVMSHKQLWLQQGKDYIDLCKYLAGSGATYLGLKGQEPERFSQADRFYLSAQDEADLRGVARTRSSKPGMPTYTFGLPRYGRFRG